jgi:hypothetical protein
MRVGCPRGHRQLWLVHFFFLFASFFGRGAGFGMFS